MSWQYAPITVAGVLALPIVISGIRTALRTLREGGTPLDLDETMRVHVIERDDVR